MSKRVKCLYCHRSYSSKNARSVHVNAKHKANPKVYPCPNPGCNHVFGSASARWRHKVNFCAYAEVGKEAGNAHGERKAHPEPDAFGDTMPNVTTTDEPNTITGALFPTWQTHDAPDSTPSSLPMPSAPTYWSQSATSSNSEGLSSAASPYSYWESSDHASPQSAISFSSSSSSRMPYFVSGYESPAAASDFSAGVDQGYSHALSSEAVEAWHSNLPNAFDLGPPAPHSAYLVEGLQPAIGQAHAHTFNDAIAPYEQATDHHASDVGSSVDSGPVEQPSLLLPDPFAIRTTDPANVSSFFDSNLPTYPATDDIFGFDYFVSDSDLDRYFALWQGAGPSAGDTSAPGSTSEAGARPSAGRDGHEFDDQQYWGTLQHFDTRSF